MFKILRCLKKLKMNQQVILFGSLVMIVVLLLILGACLIQTSILFTAIQNTSSVVTTKQEKRAIQQTSLRIQDYLQRKYEQGKKTLYIAIFNVLHIQKFFETSLDIQDYSNQLFTSCKKSTENKQILIYESNLFCYQSLFYSDGVTLPDDEQIDNFKKTTSLLSQYSLLFSLQDTSQLFLVDLPKAQMMLTYPQNYQVMNYSVKSRPWYKQYQKEHETNPNQSYYHSPVFLSAMTNELVSAIEATIYDQNDVIIGLTAQSLILSDKYLQALPLNVILANNDGQIIQSSIDSINDAKDYIFINNTQYTGFNESDWDLILNYTNNVISSEYYCDGFSDTFCLFNKYFNRKVQIHARRFQQQNFTLVVQYIKQFSFVNVTFTTELEQQYQQLTSQLSQEILQIEWILILTCFVMITLAVIMIQIIFLPLFQLMQAIKHHIKTLGNNLDKQIFTITRKLVPQLNIFSKLSIKFLSLQDILGKSQIQKSDLCQKIEKFQYNKKPNQYDLANIKSIIEPLNQLQSRSFNRFSSIFNLQLNEIYQKNR